MDQSDKNDGAAVYRKSKPYDKVPFDGEALGRKNSVVQLTELLKRMRNGAVITLEADWGEGKTYFARNWGKHLEEGGTGWLVVFIDAFESDHVADPFVVLYGAIRGALEERGIKEIPSKLRDKGISVLRNLLPVVAKAAIKVGTLNLVDGEVIDGVKDAASDALGDASKSFVADQLEDYEKSKKSIGEFRELLATAAEKVIEETGQPLVVFIDELDRCRPDYAVRMLERIKHFFEVPNIIFILIINRKQLEGAINGVYGDALDASSYLNKFIDFSMPLPKKSKLEVGFRSDNQSYCDHLSKFFGFPQQKSIHKVFTRYLGEFSTVREMSLRQIERCFTCFIISISGKPIQEMFGSALAFLIIVRVTNRDLYLSLVRKEKDSVRNLIIELNKMIDNGAQSSVISAIIQWLVCFRDGGTQTLGEDLILNPFAYGISLEPEKIISYLARMIDKFSD